MPLLNYFTSSGLRADGEKKEVTVAQGVKVNKGDFVSTGLDITGLTEGTPLAFSTFPVAWVRCLKLSEKRAMIFYPEYGNDGRNIYASLIGIENGEMTVISETNIGYGTNGASTSMNAKLLSDGTVLFISTGTSSGSYTYWYVWALRVSNDEVSVGNSIRFGRIGVGVRPSDTIPPEIYEISGSVYYVGTDSYNSIPSIIPLAINELTIEAGTATQIDTQGGGNCSSCLHTPNTLLVAGQYSVSHIAVSGDICTVEKLGSIDTNDGVIASVGFNRYMRFTGGTMTLFQYKDGIFATGATRGMTRENQQTNFPGTIQTSKKYILFISNAKRLEVARPLLGELDRGGMEIVDSFPLPDDWTGIYGNIIEFSEEKIFGAYPYYPESGSPVKELRCRMFSMKEIVTPARNQATGIALSSGEAGETITVSILI